MDGFFSSRYLIETYMCDRNGNLLPSFALKLVQGISTVHCEKMGVYKQISARNQVFLIARQACKFNRQIISGETVVLHTAPLVTTHGIFPRMTYFESESGEKLGFCDARWFLFDRNNGRLMRKMDDDIDFPAVLNLPLEKIAFPNIETEFLRNETVRYSQIDTNMHLNNTEYLNYLSDTLEDAEISEFCVNYKKEIKNGSVRLEMASFEDKVLLVGFNNGEKCFEILAKAEKN